MRRPCGSSRSRAGIGRLGEPADAAEVDVHHRRPDVLVGRPGGEAAGDAPGGGDGGVEPAEPVLGRGHGAVEGGLVAHVADHADRSVRAAARRDHGVELGAAWRARRSSAGSSAQRSTSTSRHPLGRQGPSRRRADPPAAPVTIATRSVTAIGCDRRSFWARFMPVVGLNRAQFAGRVGPAMRFWARFVPVVGLNRRTGGRRERRGGIGHGQRASTAATRSAVRRSRRAAPSSAVAPVGSPRTPLGDTDATPPSRRAGSSSPIGRVSPASARSSRTAIGAQRRAASTSRCGRRGRRRSVAGRPGQRRRALRP